MDAEMLGCERTFFNYWRGPAKLERITATKYRITDASREWAAAMKPGKRSCSQTERSRAWYLANKERVRQRRLARIEAMTDEEREQMRTRDRELSRQKRRLYPDYYRRKSREAAERHRAHRRKCGIAAAGERFDDIVRDPTTAIEYIAQSGDIVSADYFTGDRRVLRDELIRNGYECIDIIRAIWRRKNNHRGTAA